MYDVVQDKKKQPAHGADLLRLWVATVDYGNDICIGPTVLASCAEALRRIRNSARFILGNLGAGGREPWERMDRSQLSLVSKSERARQSISRSAVLSRRTNTYCMSCRNWKSLQRKVMNRTTSREVTLCSPHA
jgi:isoleucyl-tRNA synthetase